MSQCQSGNASRQCGDNCAIVAAESDQFDQISCSGSNDFCEASIENYCMTEKVGNDQLYVCRDYKAAEADDDDGIPFWCPGTAGSCAETTDLSLYCYSGCSAVVGEDVFDTRASCAGTTAYCELDAAHYCSVDCATVRDADGSSPVFACSDPMLDLSTAPMFSIGAASPNIVFTLDDSFSMLHETISGSDANFIFPLALANATNPTYGVATGIDDSMVMPTVEHVYSLQMRSSSKNALYYNPQITYEPWTWYAPGDLVASPFVKSKEGYEAYFDSDGNVKIKQYDTDGNVSVIDEVCAPLNPANLDAGCLVLNKVASVIPGGAVINETGGSALDPKVAQYFYPAVYYTYDDGDGCTVNEPECYTEHVIGLDSMDFDSISSSVYSKVNGIPYALTSTDSGVTHYKSLKNSAGDYDNVDDYIDNLQNFANWFTYYRSKILLARGAAAKSFSELSTSNRLAFGTLNSSTVLTSALDGTEIDSSSTMQTGVKPFVGLDRSSFFATLFAEDNVNLAVSSPIAKGLDDVGHYFKYPEANYDTGPWSQQPAKVDGELIANAETCRRSYHIMVSDGGEVGATTHSGESTLEAVAYAYYGYDLQASIINGDYQVVDLDGDDAANAGYGTEYGEDSITHQHLVNHVIALGESSVLGFSIPALSDPIPTAAASTLKDDMFYAAAKTGGRFFEADNFDNLYDAIRKSLQSTIITSSSASSGASVALNSGALFNGSVLFQALFDSSDWSGALYAYLIDSDTGQLPVSPSAVFTLPPEADRNIATYGLDGADGSGVEFDLIDSGGLASVDIDVAGAQTLRDAVEFDSDLQEKAVDWLRGSVTYDGTTQTDSNGASYSFRDRTVTSNYITQDDNNDGINDYSPLGDIVYSAPVYVGQPPSNYLLGDDYAAFRYNNCIVSDDINCNCNAYDGDGVCPYLPRRELVFTGANDGMLHIFEIATSKDNDSGEVTIAKSDEIAAYVPKAVIEEGYLSGDYGLTVSSYEHKYFVDGTVDVSPAYFDSAWHMVVVGGLGGGGKGVYAIDITDTDSSADSDDGDGLVGDLPGQILWEYTAKTPIGPSGHTDTPDDDLGYTYSRPVVAKLPYGDDEWGVIFGNGYNSEDDDGDAWIYILDMKTGEPIVKYNTQVGFDEAPIDSDLGVGVKVSYPNGMSSPAIVDLDNDGDVDAIYAGDLYGNLWRFDLCDPSSNNCRSTDFQSSNLDASGKPEPIFQAGIFTSGSEHVQSITTKPQVTKHPDSLGGYMVYFGTGKYIENSDRLSADAMFDDVQTFYGIWDINKSAAEVGLSSDQYLAFGRDDLLKQEIVKEVSINYVDDPKTTEIDESEISFNYRISTDYSLAWHEDTTTLPSAANPAVDYWGWYIDLYNTEGGSTATDGERQITDSIVRNGRIIFTTTVPDGDYCGSSDTGWIMELDAKNGGYLTDSPFDTNGNGTFESGDLYSYDPDGDNTGVDPKNIAVSGRQSTVGILPTPGILSDYSDAASKKEFKYMSGSDGKIEAISENAGNVNHGRQSWRQLFR